MNLSGALDNGHEHGKYDTSVCLKPHHSQCDVCIEEEGEDMHRMHT